MERVRAAFSDHESSALWEGMMKMVREQEGAEEAFQSLSSREQRGFEAMQNAGMHRDIYDESDETVQELVEQAREAFEALDEGERQRVESALTSRARSVFEEVRSKIESSQSEESLPSEESQDESEDQSRGRSRGGYDRF